MRKLKRSFRLSMCGGLIQCMVVMLCNRKTLMALLITKEEKIEGFYDLFEIMWTVNN